MKQSELYIKTLRESPADEEAINAKLLIRAGFIHKEMAGVYSFLPLGLRAIKKIEAIIREEMDGIGGNEILMPVLQPKENWEKTKRWESFDVLYKVQGQNGKWMALGPTHEEIIVPLAKKYINSYRDLPSYYYQIQTKFRDEPRSKSGLLRGREFIMKDFYSFHRDENDLNSFYKKVMDAYKIIFERIGINAVLTEASGGAFSKHSHEYQVVSDVGEDIIFTCASCGFAKNKEISEVKNGDKCPNCGNIIEEKRAVECGNIFKLGTRFSEAFDLKYKDEQGNEHFPYIGCYGAGIGRILGVIAELNHDKNGLIWPERIAPFKIHLLEFKNDLGKDLYGRLARLQGGKNNVLYDDRDITPGEKLKDSDLIGLPYRAIISEKTGDKIELKKRNEDKTQLVTHEFLEKLL
ncbi:MAG TPA: aminoacyl--tRNA ligase-related protein [Candidatus Paceibacterota bacterium]